MLHLYTVKPLPDSVYGVRRMNVAQRGSKDEGSSKRGGNMQAVITAEAGQP